MKLHTINRMPTLIAGLLLLTSVASVDAQTPDPASHSTHSPGDTSAASDTAAMQQEISKLREQMRQLEQKMQSSTTGRMQQGGGMQTQNKGTTPPMQSGMKGGGMRPMENEMGMPMDKMKPTASMSAPGSAMGMGMDKDMMRMMHGNDDMMGMGAMGGMKAPAARATPSALPGFPGQSHLYHIGSTDFFLDHPEHISLTVQQQQSLGQKKQESLLKQRDFQRQIDAAEQELWQLTAADQPQLATIEKKAREIERLRGDKRIAFIRAVGDAAKALTDNQRKQLTGMAPAQPVTDQIPMPMPDNNKPKDGMGSMGDM
ncbi:MAG: hypothetical protein AB7T07_08770 [Steroidobacteraceae bacterium]